MKKLHVSVQGEEAREWLVEQDDSHLQLQNDEHTLQVDILGSNERGTVFLLNGKKYHVAYRNNAGCRVDHHHLEVIVKTPSEQLRDSLVHLSGDTPDAHDIKVSMPGLVIKLLVGTGDRIETGDGLVIVEAMKMENVIKAPQAGIVKEIYVTPGQAIEKGAPLLHLGITDGEIV
ncbi:MAG: hypothetical protein ISR91_04605 [Candidatus Delongbacteria bacterium]|nr:hypothetical protein [Candidatus Delongbacteria bacterium]